MTPTFSALLAFLIAVTSTVSMATDGDIDYTDLNRLSDVGELRSPQTKRYYFGYRYSNDYQPRRRQLDRFRFALAGLGKRSVPELARRGLADVQEEIDRTDKTNDLALVKTILKGRLSTCESGNCNVNNDDRVMSSQDTDIKLRKSALRLFKKLLLSTDSYKKLESVLRDLTQGKRAPEEFSQDLYPIQAGTQQIEANLDKTFTHIPQLPNAGMMSVKILNPRLPLTPPAAGFDELDTHQELQDDNEQAQVTDNELETAYTQKDRPVDIVEVPHKRWWAARSLRRFRTPKSHRMRFFPKHVDPALYFLGLGK